MNNPLDGVDIEFSLTLRLPKPMFSQTKEGPVYYWKSEVTEEEFHNLTDANQQGLVIECQARVTHRNGDKLLSVDEANNAIRNAKEDEV